jgi:hypothetical protein
MGPRLRLSSLPHPLPIHGPPVWPPAPQCGTVGASAQALCGPAGRGCPREGRPALDLGHVGPLSALWLRRQSPRRSWLKRGARRGVRRTRRTRRSDTPPPRRPPAERGRVLPPHAPVDQDPSRQRGPVCLAGATIPGLLGSFPAIKRRPPGGLSGRRVLSWSPQLGQTSCCKSIYSAESHCNSVGFHIIRHGVRPNRPRAGFPRGSAADFRVDPCPKRL